MYKLRIKIFLGLIAAVLLVLVGKMFHLQIIRGHEYRRQAEEAMRKTKILPVMRGQVTDRRGRILAIDEPSFDLCLDYRLITGNPRWIAWQKRRIRRARKAATAVAAQPAAADGYEQRAELTWTVAADLAREANVDLDRRVAQIIRRVQAIRRIVNLRRLERGPVADEEGAHAVVTGLDEATALKLKDRMDKMVGAEVRPSHRRWYPYGRDACHVIGLTGPVSQQEMDRLNLKKDQAEWLERMRRNYLPVDTIGKTGVEKMCEGRLRGRRGYRRYRLTGETLEEQRSVQGADVHLTLDIVLQRRLAELLETRGHTGSIVVLTVGTRAVPQCDVLALVSVPTYDLNRYRREYRQLVTDTVKLPLMNRAVVQRYQPGSTIKPVVALAALGNGAITLTGTVTCRRDPAARHFRCWSWPMGFDHGPQNTVEALKHSCNPYFCEVGRRMGIRKLCNWLLMLGFAEPPGTGLPEEHAGTVPTERWMRGKGERWLRRHGRHPQLYHGGDVKNISIGQGLLTATPLHVANAVATVARDGVFLSPRLTLEGGPKQVRRDLPLKPEHLRAVRQGMYQVVNARGGTAYKYFHGPGAVVVPGIEIAGKTGTATTAPQRVDSNGNGRIDLGDRIVRTGDTAWFVGFAPYGRPQIAFAVAIEYVEGGGGRIAGPVAQELVRVCHELGYVN